MSTHIYWSDNIPQEGVLRWHVAVAKPGEDHIAKQALRVRGYRVYRPIMPWQSRDRRRRVQDGSKSIFPGYLFVQPHPAGWEALRTAPGMIYGERALLKTNGEFATISHDDPAHIGYMQIRQLELSLWTVNMNGEFTEPKFKIGDQVKIKKGPWIQFCGQIERLDDNDRAWVLFQFLGGTRHALISFDHLSRAEALG